VFGLRRFRFLKNFVRSLKNFEKSLTNCRNFEKRAQEWPARARARDGGRGAAGAARLKIVKSFRYLVS
jgi:hypothetical protein